MQQILENLKWTSTTLKNTYGFDYTGINGKVSVVMEKLNVYGFFSENYGNISINENNCGKIAEPSGLYQNSLTAVHEFLHCVTFQYRDRFNLYGFAYDNVWPDEATAMWIETVRNGNAESSLSSFFFENFENPFKVGLSLSAREAPDKYGSRIQSMAPD